MRAALATAMLCAGALTAIAGTHRVFISVNPPPGRSMQVAETVRMELTTTVRAADGKLLGTSKRTVADFTDSIDSTVAHDGTERSYRREYVLSESESDGKHHRNPEHGRAFLFHYRAGTFEVTDERRTVLDAELKKRLMEIARQSDRAEAANLCVPSRSIDIGERWTLTRQEVSDCFGSVGELVAASGEGVFREVDAKGNAVIEFQFEQSVASMNALRFDVPAHLTGRTRIRVALAEPMRWRRETTATMTGTATNDAQQAMTVELSATEKAVAEQ